MAAEEMTFGQRMSARCAGFGKFLYNSDEGKIIGRTPKSWALITVFYLIYYSCLAGFFIGMLSVLLYGVIETDVPRLTGDHSLLKLNPGLAMRPQPDIDRTLIAYDMKKPDTISTLVKNIKELAKSYEKQSGEGVEYVDCDLSDAQANKEFDPTKKLCKANVTASWGECAPDKLTDAYKAGKPCVIVKMNKIYGWLPDTKENSSHAMLHCKGENAGDEPNIGDVTYYPSVKGKDNKTYGRFSSGLFPYLKQPGYISPTVAVQFGNIRQNVLVMIECRLSNLRNSKYDKMDKEAMVRFEVVVYNKA